MSTAIEWCDDTINPLRARNIETGAVGHFCEKVSPGCTNCYASEWNERVRPNGDKLIGTGLAFDTRNRDKVEHFLDVAKLEEVLRRRKPTRYFWCDMTDMFGTWVPDEWLDRIVATMALTPHHTHLVLTKRAERMRDYVVGLTDRLGELWDLTNQPTWVTLPAGRSFPRYPENWPLPNVRWGVSVEDQPRADRFDVVSELGEKGWNTMVSMEPLLEDVPIAARYLALGPRAWVIPGAESGGRARVCNMSWILRRVTECQDAGVAAFVKQLGANAVRTRAELAASSASAIECEHGFDVCPTCDAGSMPVKFKHPKGGNPAEWPPAWRVRQFPEVLE